LGETGSDAVGCRKAKAVGELQRKAEELAGFLAISWLLALKDQQGEALPSETEVVGRAEPLEGASRLAAPLPGSQGIIVSV
jgi:hypothetical protein